MKPQNHFLLSALLLAVMIGTLGCGDKQADSASNTSPNNKKLATLSSPDLETFEPKAKETLEKQRADLDQLIEQKDTPKSTLALAFGQMGTQYFAHRFPEQATECFENAVILQPNTFRWRYFLARLHMEENRHEEAEAAFKKVLELQPSHAPSKVLLGQLLINRGDFTAAEPLLTEALQAEPKNALAHRGMGRVMLEKKAFPSAARHLQTCLLLQPFARSTHGLLAKALHGMDQPEAAALQERAVANREPIMRDPLMNEVTDQRFLLLYRIGEALRMNQRDSDAVQMYELAINIRPDISGPRLGRVLSQIRSGEHQKAIVSLQDDILAGQDTSNFKHMLARLYAASPESGIQNPQKALQILDTLRKEHMTPGLYETIAMAMASLDKFPSAIQYQETAIEMASQAEQPNLLPILEKNLALYRKKQACPAPWAKDDPIFEMVTYRGEAQIEKRPGA